MFEVDGQAPRRVSAMPADRQSRPSPKGWVHPNGGLTRTPTSPGDRTPPPLKNYLTHPKPNTTQTNKQTKTDTDQNGRQTGARKGISRGQGNWQGQHQEEAEGGRLQEQQRRTQPEE